MIYKIIIAVFSYAAIRSYIYNSVELNKKQHDYILNVLSTDEVNALKTEDYIGRANHNYALCETMNHMVMIDSIPRFIGSKPIHDFTKRELSLLNQEYMEKIYNPCNFPITYRNFSYVSMSNNTANTIFHQVCYDYYKEKQSEYPGYLIGVLMIAIVSLKELGWINETLS